MRVRRHFDSLQGVRVDTKTWKWIGIGAGMVLAGYHTAYLILFPAPILPGHQSVPRVFVLTLAELLSETQKSKMQVTDVSTEPHLTAPAGIVISQDPPPRIVAPARTKVTRVA